MNASYLDELGDDDAIVAALRDGDDRAFAALIDRYHSAMLRVARGFVADQRGRRGRRPGDLAGCHPRHRRLRSTLVAQDVDLPHPCEPGQDTWRAESRTRPFSSLAAEVDEPTVDPSRFIDSGRWQGFWSAPPTRHAIPEQHVLASEASDRVLRAVDGLPPNQQVVITLRDIQGLSAAEVCDLLSISEANQRVLLHRARSKVRAVLEVYLDDRAVKS